MRTPCHRQHGALMSREGMGTGARTQIHESNSRMLSCTRYKKMVGDWRKSMRVDDGVEIKARRRDQSLRGVDFKGVVIRGR